MVPETLAKKKVQRLMSPDSSLLPEYDNPPVVEVALSVQFAQLPLRSIHLGHLYDTYKNDFPVVEELPPLPNVVEYFGPPKRMESSIQIMTGPPVPRFWFRDNEGTKLLQVQQDRFVYNWRKGETDQEYPRYSNIKEAFGEEFTKFSDLIVNEDIGEILPDQCEVTYINHIFAGEGWERFGELGNIITTWETRYSDEFLGEPEQARFAIQYSIPDEEGNPIGRLYIVLEPRHRISDNKPLLQLNLTARGKPVSAGEEGILGFMDIGHEWIVRGFTSVTTSKMHEEIWRRTR